MKQGTRLVAAAVVALTTLGTSVHRTTAATPPSGVLSGKVLSGHIPIAGATITLYGAVQTCVPDPCRMTSMAVAKTHTDTQGRFTIDLSKASVQVPMPVSPPGFTTEMMRERPAPGSLYVIARGGNAGAGANPAAALMLALGDTNGLHGVTINEITTVVATFVYTRAIEPGSDNLVLSGATMARALVDPERGTLRPAFSEGANSPALVNTLADIVAACVRSAGPKSHPCAALLAAAPPVDRPRALYKPYSGPLKGHGGGAAGGTMRQASPLALKPTPTVCASALGQGN